MSIFSPQDEQLTRERQFGNLAPFKPTEFLENTGSALRTFQNNDYIDARRAQQIDAYDERIASLEKMTGQKLTNPYSRAPWWGRSGHDQFRDPDNAEQNERMKYSDWIPDTNPIQLAFRLFDERNGFTEPQRLRQHEAEVERLRATLSPRERAMIPTADDISGIIAARAQELDATNKNIAARATGWGTVGQFTGTGIAATIQPEVLVTLPLGAPARVGLLARVLIEAGIGMGSEALMQPSVQAQRAELGLEHGFWQGAENVGMAGLGAGGFTLGGAALLKVIKLVSKGGAEAMEKALGRPLSRDERVLADAVQRDADTARATPYEEQTQAAERVRLHNENVGTEAAAEGAPIDQARLLPDENLQRRALEADGATMRVFHNRELEQIGVDAETMQFKSGGDQQGVTDRLAGVKTWDLERAGIALVYEYADGRMIIADGHQRLGLAKRLAGEGQDIEFPAIILREVDGVSPKEARARAALKNIAEGTGTALDAAKVLRDLGTTMEELNLPPRSALVLDAEGLSRLDDEVLGMVINKVLNEQTGAAIGRLVDDPRMHPAIAKLLARLKPANAFETEAIIRQAREAGFATERQATLFGEEDVAESLYLERARVLDRALKMARRNTDTFKTLSERTADIEAEGNILNQASNAERLATEQRLMANMQASANMKGPISDELQKAALAARESGNYQGAARDFLAAIARGIDEGKINGDALSRNGPGDEPGRTGAAAQEASQGSEFEPIDDQTLSMFDEPMGKAADDQALRIAEEIKDEAQAHEDALREAYQGDIAMREDLAARIDEGVPLEQLDSHPAILKALDDAMAIPRTDLADGFDGPEWRANRVFTIDGKTVKGTDNAVNEFMDAFARVGREAGDAPPEAGRRAFIVLGPPAAGKSSIAEPLARHHRLMIVDPDEVKKTLPEYGDGSGANAVHEESSLVAGEVLDKAAAQGMNILIPKVGGNAEKMAQLVEGLARDGYEVNVVNMAVKPDEAYRRMLKRFVNTGRLIVPEYMREVGESPSRTYQALAKNEKVKAHAEIDNNGPPDAAKPTKDSGGITAGVDFATPRGRGPGDGSLPGKAGATPSEGRQAVIPGAERASDATMAQRGADAPLRPKADQRPTEFGLFGDSNLQADLLDTPVPIGERIDADGNRVADVRTVRQLMDELEADQDFIETLSACGGGAAA